MVRSTISLDVEQINAVLVPLGFARMTPEELAPLCAA
jgi:hypothetical protein